MKEACKLLDYNYDKLRKKWNTILILGFLGTIFLYVILHEIFVIIFFFLMYLYVQNDQQYIRNYARKLKLQKQQEFVNFVAYITIFLENKFNVYQSLKICIPYLDKSLQKDIETFVQQIDVDKTIIPYINIAENIGTSLIMQMMVMLYQININGFDAKYLHKFPYLIDKAYDLLTKEKIQHKKNEMGIYAMVPIISLLIMVFIMVFQIIGMVGGVVV